MPITFATVEVAAFTALLRRAVVVCEVVEVAVLDDTVLAAESVDWDTLEDVD